MWIVPLLALAAVVVVTLRLIFGAPVTHHIIAICAGVFVGLLFGYAELWGPTPTLAEVLAMIELPVDGLFWVLAHLFGISDLGFAGVLLHFVYWAYLGGLLFFGAAVVYAKATGNE
jgi:hypothetical protein